MHSISHLPLNRAWSQLTRQHAYPATIISTRPKRLLSYTVDVNAIAATQITGLRPEMMETRMKYGLRLNHHSDNHDELLLGAVKPALDDARERLGNFSTAIRSHWLNGPHLLIGIEGLDAQAEEQAFAIIAERTQNWMIANPSNVLNPPEHAKKSMALAEVEKIYVEDHLLLRPRDTTERGCFEVPNFLSDARLSEIRDRFMASCLDEIFSLLEVKAQSEPALLIALAERFLAIEALSDLPILSFWPMSLRGQVETTAGVTPETHQRFQQTAEKIAPNIRPTSELTAESDRAWIELLGQMANELDAYVSMLPQTYFDVQRETILQQQPPEAAAFKARLRGALSSPYHFAYRAFVNMIYALFPLLGLSASKRIFVCHLVIFHLGNREASILQRTSDAAQALVFK